MIFVVKSDELIYFQSRAKQLYSAGFKSLEDVAKANANELVDKIEHLTNRVARQLISAAKVIFCLKIYSQDIFSMYLLIFT